MGPKGPDRIGEKAQVPTRAQRWPGRFFAASVSSMLRILHCRDRGTSWMPVSHDDTSCCLIFCPCSAPSSLQSRAAQQGYSHCAPVVQVSQQYIIVSGCVPPPDTACTAQQEYWVFPCPGSLRCRRGRVDSDLQVGRDGVKVILLSIAIPFVLARLAVTSLP